MKNKITIVYNNEAKKNLKFGWGFSCLVDTGQIKILFDTGTDGPALIYNLKKLKINVNEIDAVFISHDHWDHTGGIFSLLDLNKNLKIFFPSGFSSTYLNEVRRWAEVYQIRKGRKIFESLFSTGTIKCDPVEQALLVETRKGFVVIVGCSHPGVDKILEKASKFGKIYGILGGMHGFKNMEALNKLELIIPCHCTKYIKKIERAFPSSFKKVVGGDKVLL